MVDPASPVAPRRAPGLRKKLALMALSGVVLLAIGEWAVKHFNIERLSYTNPELYRPDAVLGYRMKPDVRVYSHGAWYETNRAGLRGPHWDDVHAAGKECVLFVGHSIGGGFGVTAEEAYPGVFTELDRAGLVGINLGHSGYRYWQELALAESLLDQVRPAAIVVMFTGNDFEPQYDPFTRSNIDGEGTDDGSLPIPGKEWLRRNSALYHYLRKSWSRLLLATGVREMPAHLEYERLKGLDDESRAYWAAYEEQLGRLARASGAPIVLTAFPMGQSPESYERLRGIAERLGARWVDFSDLWKDVGEYRSRGALAWSEHPNAATHRLLAERLTPVVEEVVVQARSRQGG